MSLGSICFTLAIAAAIFAYMQFRNKRRRFVVPLLALAFALGFISLRIAPTAGPPTGEGNGLDSTSAALKPVDDGSSQPDSQATPTDPPTQSPAQERAYFISQVHRDLTAVRIAGNWHKHVDEAVALHCKILNIVRGDDVTGAYANAVCGESNVNVPQPKFDPADPTSSMERITAWGEQMQKSAEDSALLLLAGDKVANLEGGETYRVYGIVAQAIEAKNHMGVETEYPVISIRYVQ